MAVNLERTYTRASFFFAGTTLRNTSYVYGLVLNSGYDTKIMMSNSEVPFKTSALDLSVNREIWNMLLLEFMLCVVGATGSVILVSKIAPNFACSEWAVIAHTLHVCVCHVLPVLFFKHVSRDNTWYLASDIIWLSSNHFVFWIAQIVYYFLLVWSISLTR